ncbi:MAG: DNA polymerase I [Bacteroidales bacterium]|nr:DNA polymerase I [Bacteroidales bacterium]
MKKFFLIDAFALIYRSFYALNKNPRLNSKGMNTSAILGFANTILDIINKYHPDLMAIAFESKSPTFRKEQYEDYKANREAMPEDIRENIPYIERFVEAMRIKNVSCEGYEADDVIGSLAKKAKKEGFDVYMVTPDKDYAQLVEDNISILKLATGFSKEQILTKKEILEKYEIKNTKQIIDLLGLMGDSSDNIPGVPTIGEKKAKALLQQFDSIEDILAHSDEIANKSIRKAIEENREKALFSKELATIRLDVPIDFIENEFEMKTPDFVACNSLFEDLEFRKFSERFYKVFSNGEVLLKEKVDTVEQSENQQVGQPDLFSFSNKESLQTSVSKPIVIDKHSEYYPIILAGYLIDPEQRMDSRYIMENADVIKEEYLHKLKQDGLEKLYYEVEMPLKDVLLDMEKEGVRFDKQAIEELSDDLQKEKDVLQEEIFLLAGERFNISSPKQLGEILFDKLNVQGEAKAKKTHSKQFSTAEDVLLKLKDNHPVIEKVLKYREIAKLKNTYVDALPLLVNPNTGKIHTTFNQTVTATGRLSSNNPNLQNIPIRTERGKAIRKAFVASDDNHLLLSADYSQIELRIIASMSGDEHLCSEFAENHDIHRATAAKIYGISQEDVTKQMRSVAKSVNFGIIYGVSAFGLSQQLGIKRTEAQNLIDQYFNSFPKIAQFIQNRISFARSNGYAVTLLGRRRYLPNINSANGNLRSFDERNAVNMTIQGTGADMIKVAMVKMYDNIKARGLKSKMILQIHDELIFDVVKSELEEMKSLVKQTMENALPLVNVPVVAEMGWGDNWLEIH